MEEKEKERETVIDCLPQVPLLGWGSGWGMVLEIEPATEVHGLML